VATLDYGDQSRIANRSGPENSLPLEVALKVKDAGISIVDRTPQTHNYFDAITGAQFERVEERNEFRIFKELGQTCAPAIRNAVYRVDVNVEVDAEASPVRTLQQAANDPAGFVSGGSDGTGCSRERRPAPRRNTAISAQDLRAQPRITASGRLIHTARESRLFDARMPATRASNGGK
jgi:hypothetical protein